MGARLGSPQRLFSCGDPKPSRNPCVDSKDVWLGWKASSALDWSTRSGTGGALVDLPVRYIGQDVDEGQVACVSVPHNPLSSLPVPKYGKLPRREPVEDSETLSRGIVST